MSDAVGKAVQVVRRQQPSTNVSTMQFLYSIDNIVDIVIQWPNCLLPRKKKKKKENVLGRLYNLRSRVFLFVSK